MTTGAPSPDTGELLLKGIPAAPGIAVGPAYVYTKHVPVVTVRTIEPAEVEVELSRLRTANERAEKELVKIHTFAEQKLGTQQARIFEAQVMILNDTILMGAIERRIREELRNAEFVVADEIGKYKRLMLAASDEYMHERAHDVDDVMNRILRNIQDQKLFSRLEGECIIVAETLTPADTVIFSRNQILGYATDLGGTTSHAAILSRSLQIPAVAGLRGGTRRIRTGDLLALDGYNGVVAVNPSEETLRTLERKRRRYREFEEHLAVISDLAAETTDHHHVELSANLEFPGDVPFARSQGAAGIGLYRTERLLLERTGFPDEEEQAAEYEAVAAAIAPQPVIFRTFDAGGDKLVADLPHEDNPFLGWRGIRVMLDRPAEFRIQLRAILRASTRRNVRIMLPMVTIPEEVRRARAELRAAQDELAAAGIPFDAGIKLGVMIEVPAAALQAGDIAAEADFLSIGTNDLVQYLLAVDRGNSNVAGLYEEFTPAVLRLIRDVIIAGHKRGRWVGMCGEMAGDPLATMLLVGLGLDEFSVVPAVLPEIKQIIRTVRSRDARKIAERALALPTAEEIRRYLTGEVRSVIPDLPLGDAP